LQGALAVRGTNSAFVNLASRILEGVHSEITEDGAYWPVARVAETVPFAARRENHVAGLHRNFAVLCEMFATPVENIEKLVAAIVSMQEMGGARHEGTLPDNNRPRFRAVPVGRVDAAETLRNVVDANYRLTFSLEPHSFFLGRRTFRASRSSRQQLPYDT